MKKYVLQIAVFSLLCFTISVIKTRFLEEETNSKAIEGALWSPRSRKVADPKYVLDPEKFLTAFVSRGPNNQIYSLRETIYIAITLNRTLILPLFFKHDRGDPTSNGSNTAIVDFEQRIDVEKLRELIPVLLTNETRNKCPDGIEKIFRAQNICLFKENPPRLAAAQQAMNLPIIFDKQNICDDKSKASEVIPDEKTIDKVLEGVDKKIAIRRVLRMKDPEIIKELFEEGKESRCAATGFPYESVNFMNLISQKQKNGESELAREIIKFTERPKHIRNLISKFIRLYSGNRKNPNFMAIHWRYDEQDWKNEQCRRRPDFLICKDFDIMRDPERLSNEIENYLSNLEEDFDFIYIAAPPSELTLIEGVGKSFARKGLIPIVSQVEMSELMRAEFQAQCGDETFESLKFEILSMLDSEICVVAPVFYYSIMSSYSMNIQQERTVRTKGVTRFNGEIFGDARYSKTT